MRHELHRHHRRVGDLEGNAAARPGEGEEAPLPASSEAALGKLNDEDVLPVPLEDALCPDPPGDTERPEFVKGMLRGHVTSRAQSPHHGSVFPVHRRRRVRRSSGVYVILPTHYLPGALPRAHVLTRFPPDDDDLAPTQRESKAGSRVLGLSLEASVSSEGASAANAPPAPSPRECVAWWPFANATREPPCDPGCSPGATSGPAPPPDAG